MRPSSNVISLPRAPLAAPELARTLAAEASEVGTLIDILRDEQRALLARDYERVHSLAMSKAEHYSRLGSLNGSRCAALRAAGLPANRTGMQAAADRSPLLAEPWNRLVALAETARRLNLSNGRLIATEMRFASGALAALEQGAAQFALYGADGQPHQAPLPRSLASA